MKFCPSCEIRLKRSDLGLRCPKCGHVEGTGEKTPDRPAAEEPEIPHLNVLDKGAQTPPTITTECEKCGHDKAVWWMLQTRSADEATTQFYRCVRCSHTWRNYD